MPDLTREWSYKLPRPVADPCPAGRNQAGDPLQPNQGVIVLLVDPRPLSRESISFHLNARAPDLHIRACSRPQDIDRRPELADVDLALLNIGAGRIDAPEVMPTIGTLKAKLPAVPLAVLTDHADADLVVDGLRLGLRGYVTSDVDVGVMAGALRLIAAGGTFVPATAVLAGRGGHIDEAADEAEAITGLTRRQREVLERLRLGKTNKVIAYELNMCESTVKVHVRHIMRKLGASNRTQAVYLARTKSPAVHD